MKSEVKAKSSLLEDSKLRLYQLKDKARKIKIDLQQKLEYYHACK